MNVETDFTLTVKTNRGNVLTETVSVELTDVLSYSWVEECHGYHEITEPDEIDVERKLDEFLEDLTSEKANDLFAGYFDLDDEIIEEIL